MWPTRLSSNKPIYCHPWQRPHNREAGFNLVEILIVLAVMGIVSSFMFPAFMQFQDEGVKEINKNDLYDRGQRLSIYLSHELSMAGFLLGRRPEPTVVIAGINYDATIVVNNSDSGDDEITILKAESFFPKLTSSIAVAVGGGEIETHPPTALLSGMGGDDRRNRLGLEADTAYNHLAFENHKRAYRLDDLSDNGVTFGAVVAPGAGLPPYLTTTLHLAEGLREDLSAGSEILKVRGLRFHLVAAGGESQLRCDDGKNDEILDRAVNGIQFRYLLADGSWNDSPPRAEDIRAIRIYLLARALKPQKGLTNSNDYSSQMGPNVANHTYGPYNDSFPRLVILEDVEVKNYAAR